MVRIAVTGGVACGKSLVASFLAAEAVPTCDADDVAHAVMRPGEPVYQAVRAAFGPGVLGLDGELDRARLGRLVFDEPQALARLNALVHPEVLRRLRAWVTEHEAAGAPLIAAVIPLLYEIRDETAWDVVVCVGAPEADQLRRLRDRGLTEAEARSRVAAQLPLAEKMERADRVLFNCGTPDLLREQTKRMMRSLRGD